MKKDDKSLDYTSEKAFANNPLSHNRPEVMIAFYNLRNALEKSALMERAQKWDLWRSKDYWSTIREMGARTFEQYVKDKLAEKGVENDFLANIFAVNGDNNVYLNEEEKAPIYEAYDKLFDTLQTRETDKGVELYQGGENNAVDLTEEFNEQPTKTDVEKYLEKIIGLPLKTGTPPLQVQVTEDNIPHIIRTNVSLHGSKKREHLKAVNFLEKILSKSVKVGEEPVDLTHNTSQETLDHKKTLEKYIYFEGQVKVGDDFYTVRFATEQVKGQNPNLLDIYNIHIKRGALHNSTDRPSYKNNITQSGGRVNSKKVKQGVKGSFTSSKNLIQLFKDADASTLPHEFAHYWLNNMWNYVRSGAASEKYQNRWGIVADWLGIKPTQTRIYRAQQEQFARGYEAYLWRGELPNPIIKGAFDDYDKWLKEVYNDINELNVELTDDAIRFFQSMTTGELPEPNVRAKPVEVKAETQETKPESTTPTQETNEVDSSPVAQNDSDGRRSAREEVLRSAQDDSVNYNIFPI